MRIVFDPDFDAGFWPGPLRVDPPRKAAAGEAWAGPRSLQGILETSLGLGGLSPSSSERTVTLAGKLRSQSGFWSESAEKDPIGVARTLLRWVDWLKLHGWDGQPPPSSPKTRRLVDLSKIAASILPGDPDRLRTIDAALVKRRPDIESIATYEPIDRLLPLWRRIFGKIEARGVSVGYSPPPPLSASSSSPSSDLRSALRPIFSPSGDGSLTLFRPFNPLGAAESVAAWLRSLDDLSDTLIISPSVVLDEAVRRFGLPAAGARESTNDGPFPQILPLVLAMGWNPPDPQRALELLLIPDGPVPAFLAGMLRSALQEWPAVGSPDWENKLARGLEKIPDAAQRETVRERLASIFRPEVEIQSAYPASAMLVRIQTVKKWAAARIHAATAKRPSGSPLSPGAENIESLGAIVAECEAFEKLIEISGLETFTAPQMLKLNIEISGSLRPGRRFEPQAGIVSLPSPTALAGPASRVIWWDFTLEAASSPFSLPLSRPELAALESFGVNLTPAADLAADEARRRRRPFLFAAESLLLVSPRFGEDGEDRHPHPLWDEVKANNHFAGNLSILELKHLSPSRPLPMRTDPFLPLPAARRTWAVSPRIVSPKPPYSPTSLQEMIGCSFKWALSHLGKLRDPEIAALTDNVTLMGNFSHKILADVLRTSPADGCGARVLADSLFGTLGPKFAAPLFLPGAPVQLSFVQKATLDAAAALVEILKKAGLSVVLVESHISEEGGPLSLAGRVDLVAGDPPVIIDLKWRGDSFYRDKLKNGTSTQLAAYAFILKKTAGKFPPVAYFIIQTQKMIAHQDAPFEDVERVSAPPAGETWDAFLRTALEALKTVKSGRFEALAVPHTDGEGVVERDEMADGRMALAPPCRFCSFGFLCGLDWEGGR